MFIIEKSNYYLFFFIKSHFFLLLLCSVTTSRQFLKNCLARYLCCFNQIIAILAFYTICSCQQLQKLLKL